MSGNLDLVRSIYGAWARRDYEWVEWADPAIEFVVADGPSPAGYSGLAGMWRGWQDILGPWEDWAVEDLDVRDLGGERVLALITFGGRGRTSGLDVGRVTARGANVWELRAGRVVRLFAYWDFERALADLGLEE